MKYSTSKRMQQYGRIVAACVFVFIAVFSVFSVGSANKIIRDMGFLAKNPFSIANASYNIRQNIGEMETRMEFLLQHHQASDLAFAEEALAENFEQVQKALVYIQTNLTGLADSKRALVSVIGQIQEKQAWVLQEAPNNSTAIISRQIETQLAPLYGQVNVYTLDIINFTGGSIGNFVSTANGLLGWNVLLVVVIAIVLGVLTVLYQYSNDRRAQDIQYREMLFEILSENMDSVFLIYNLNSRTMENVFSNSERVLGISSAELKKDPLALFNHFEGEELDQMKSLFRKNQIQQMMERQCVLKAGEAEEPRWMMFRIYPVKTHKKIDRYLVFLTDLTQIKKNQEVLKDALLNAQLANKAKGNFLSGMSHEIRTPMNGIIGMTAIAASNLDDPTRVKDCLSKIASSSKHLLMLINNVLDMSKIENGKLNLSDNPFSLEQLINAVSAIVYPQAMEKKLDFEITVADLTHENLMGDALRLNQVLINILSNAVKFTPTGGRVELQIKETPCQEKNLVCLQFIVRDTGIGMTDEFLTRIFHPFEQEEDRKGIHLQGTGLGMSIANNLVTLMGGEIRVKSQLGKGSTFVIELPFAVDLARAGQRENLQLQDLKVLIVDDDEDTCQHTALLLTDMGGVAEWVVSGSQAITRLQQAKLAGKPFSVCFVDWNMPGFNGIETTKAIREQIDKDLVIIIISAYDWTAIEADARGAGANGFIAKPILQSTITHTLMGADKELLGFTSAPPFEEAGSLANRFTGKRFLVVEDNDLNREIALVLLEETGAAVEGVFNGLEAVEAFEQSKQGYYDLILMDVQMPIMDGYGATKRIRQSSHPMGATIPIIAMTANAFSHDVADALASGMNGHIAKPIDMSVVCRVLDEILQK